MRKLRMLLVVVFFCFASSAFAESLVEKIEKIGFPEKDAASLAELVEQKNFSGTIDVPKGMSVSAIIRKDTKAEDVELDWVGDYPFKAEKYEKGGYVLYRLINLGNEVFFRIGELPKPIQAEAVPVVIPDPPKEEKKVEVPKASPVPMPKTKGDGVEEVYEAMALPLDLKNLGDQPITAIIIPIYKSQWIGDGLGTYTVVEKDGKKTEMFLVRKVWRAYIGAEMFPAVITKFGTNLFVIAQGRTKEDLVGKNSVIISGSGKFALTLSGNVVEFDLQNFEESEENKKAFFEKNPSQVQERILVDVSPNTENGKTFAGDLRKIFPENYFVDGKLISAGTDSETLKTLVGVSNNATYMRRVVEKGGLPNISLGSILCPPCELARMLIVWTIAAFDSSLNGNFFEAKVSGYQAAQALAPYLAECQEEMNYLTTLLARR